MDVRSIPSGLDKRASGKAYKVGVEVARELYGVMAAKRTTGGIVVTSRSFTDNAKAFADGRNVKLVDGHRLFALIKQTRESLASRTGTSERPTPVAAPAWGPEVVPKGIDDLLREASD